MPLHYLEVSSLHLLGAEFWQVLGHNTGAMLNKDFGDGQVQTKVIC